MTYMGGTDSWGGGNSIGKIYLVATTRLGNNARQPKEGSLALCVEHSGDCFYDYIPIIRVGKNKIKAQLRMRFGSYTFSIASSIKLTTEKFHLLLAGREVKT